MKIVEINAYDAIAQFDAILLTDKDFAKEVKIIIRKELSKARNEISKDTKEVIGYDPRQAYRAVRRVIYKRVLGGNINILQSRKASSTRVRVQKERKLREGQRGGNRRPRSARTEQVDSYFGADRGFILRFLNLGAGLSSERVNYNVGNARRGHITPRDWFGSKSEARITEAAERICDQIEELITRKTE